MTELTLGRIFMTNIVNEIVNLAQELVPDAPITQAIEQVAKTIEQPSIENIMADLQLAQKIIEQLKTFHPSILNIVKALL